MNYQEACEEYANLICSRNMMDKAIVMLFEQAPPEAMEALDTIKKVAEIDPGITEPALLLLRASVMQRDES